jgi:hypothetical protein
VHTVVMAITDEGAVEKGIAGLCRVDHGLISAGTLRNGALVYNRGSGLWLVPIVSTPPNVYIACQESCVLRHGGHGQA